MSINEELEALSENATEPRKNAILRYLDGLSDEDRAGVSASLENWKLSTVSIWRVLRKNGARFNQSDFTNWRNENFK